MQKKIIRITTVPISLEKLLGNQLQFINNYFNVIAISSDKERLEEYGKGQCVDTHHIEMTRKITPIQDLKCLIKLFIFFKKNKPIIVHSHTPKAGIIAMLSSFLANIPIRMHTVAGLPLLEEKGVKRVVLNFVEKLTYRCSTNVYPNSYGLKNIILENQFAKEDKLKIIANGSSNGIDTSYFDPELFSIDENEVLKTNLEIKKTDFVFIFVGRIVSDKGINELVEAFDKICLVKENIKLLLVGAFEDELDPLQKKTKQLMNNNKNIISVGYQNDVRPYFSISNCLVFPSYREGFPNVVMQAGAMGLCSIVSNINGCNEIIENNENGLIIPVKNTKEILDAMLKICSDKNLFMKLKLNSRSLIKKKYERELFWISLLKEYNDLINRM